MCFLFQNLKQFPKVSICSICSQCTMIYNGLSFERLICKVVSTVCLSEVQMIINSLLICGMCGCKLSHSNCSAIYFHMLPLSHSMMLYRVALAGCTERCGFDSIVTDLYCSNRKYVVCSVYVCMYVCMYTHFVFTANCLYVCCACPVESCS